MSGLRTGVAISHRDQLPSSSRYELLVKIASGGMATVYVGRLSSAAGISRLVAVKRAHAHLLEDGAFAKMLVAEARLASKIHHPNVVAVHNVEEIEGELLLVMDYVEGASLYELTVPPDVALRVILDACAGLHAAHGLVDDDGRPLGIVHRDVSPHNILVGIDGVARLTDFGIAKSSGHTQSGGKTSTGALKGKVSYMAPEYVESGHLDSRSDVFSLGVVAWEALTHRRLFRGATEVETLKLVLATHIPDDPSLPRPLRDVLAKALARSPRDRYASAAELGEALEVAARAVNLLASHAEVAAFVKKVAGDVLASRRALIRDRNGAESSSPTAADEPIGRTDATASIARPHMPAVDLEPTKVTPRIVDPPRRPNAAYGIALMLGVAALVVGIAKLTARPKEESTTAPAISMAPSVSVAAPDLFPPAPALSSAPVDPTPTAPTQTVATKPPAIRTHRGTTSAPGVTAKASPSPPPPPTETATATGDRAPPNPYAH